MSNSKYLVWVDLEMSGLNPEQHVIVEIATIITDPALGIIDEGPSIAIHHPDDVLEAMSPWSREHHSKSGLLKEIRKSEISTEEAEQRTLEFLQQYVEPESAPLCGNSIGQDRRFLYRYMPQLSDFLHYRNIDVSSIKELCKRWYPEDLRAPDKDGAHRAKSDILESINELRWYFENIFDRDAMSL